jgi:hypothetical protein
MKHSTMVGKSGIKNLIVTDKDMVTIAIDKGEDLSNLIENLLLARHDRKTTNTVRLWVKNGKINVSNRYKAPYTHEA